MEDNIIDTIDGEMNDLHSAGLIDTEEPKEQSHAEVIDAQLAKALGKEITVDRTSQIEADARADGWVPLEEFKGNKDSWADAKEFLRVGKIIKSRDEKAARLERELSSLKQATNNMMEKLQRAETIAYEKATRDLEARLARAKEIGDVEEALDVAERQRQLNQQSVDTVKANAQSFIESDTYKKFAPRNPWVTGTDRVSKAMQHVATEISNEYARKNPGVSAEDEVAHIEAEMIKEFPDYYNKLNRKDVQPIVQGSIAKPATSSRKEEKLSAEEKMIADFLKTQGYDSKAYLKALGK